MLGAAVPTPRRQVPVCTSTDQCLGLLPLDAPRLSMLLLLLPSPPTPAVTAAPAAAGHGCSSTPPAMGGRCQPLLLAPQPLPLVHIMLHVPSTWPLPAGRTVHVLRRPLLLCRRG